MLERVKLNGMKDRAIWVLEKSGVYSVKSMYRSLTHRGVINKRMRELWKSKLPMRIKTFMWLVCQGRIQSGKMLKRMNWKGDASCVVCGRIESADHIFFGCVAARFAWNRLGQAAGWERTPGNLRDFFDNWLPIHDKDYKTKIFGLATILWVLWNVRNKMAIEGVFITDPADILFKINILLQKWRVRLKPEDGEQLMKMVTQTKGWVETFLEARKNRAIWLTSFSED
jgi:hypothetical protein